MKIPFRSALILLLFPFALFAQNEQDPAVGDWKGKIRVSGTSLRIRFHIEEKKDGLQATMDSPDQGVSGIPVDTVLRNGDSLRIEVPKVNGNYRGIFVTPDSLSGRWSQKGKAIELLLSKGAEVKGPSRPQTPQAPYSYRSIDTSFQQEKDDLKLAGTLTIPKGKGPFPGVVLVSGSGPQDRNETLKQHEPFHVIADHLTRNGVAVLRYDDRGVAASGGSFEGTTLEGFTDDATAAYRFLKNFDRINPDKVGMLGHSEGGLVVTSIAAEREDPAFLILLASPGLRGDSTLLTQNRAILSEMGMAEDMLKPQMKILDSLTSYIRAERDSSFISDRLRHLVQQEYEEVFDSSMQEKVIGRFEGLGSSTWFRSFIQYDPFPTYKKLRSPVLALFGEKDLQVLPDPNANRMKEALRGNEKAKIETIPGVNHLFQPASTGLPSNYGKINTTIHPPVLERISEWTKGILEGK